MKKIVFILLSVMLLTACSDEMIVQDKNEVKEGDEVTLTVSINAPEQPVLKTRTLGEMTPDVQRNLNLWLLVFDGNGVFVQAAKADVGENAEHGDHIDTKFKVTLNSTSDQRIIHFVAYDGGADEGVGAIINSIRNQFGTESSMLQQLYTANGQAAYWQRLTVNGIYGDDEETDENESTVFECVPLVRNFSKITVNVDEDVDFTVDGYTLVNVPSRGAVAPYYSASFIDYVDGRVNKSYEDLKFYPGVTPPETTYSTIENDNQLTNPSTPLYLYETPNASEENKGRTALIIKGHSGNAAASYYKVDFIHNDYSTPELEADGNQFYNMLRNFAYNVTIKEVIGSGYGDLQKAIAGVPSNNLSASTTTTSLSRISDGLQMLEVSNVYYCYNAGGVKSELQYRYRYYDGTDWVTNNSLVKVKTDNDDIFTKTNNTPDWSVSGPNDGWKTITMTLTDAGSQPLTSIFHIYASASAINEATLIQNNTNANAELKGKLTSGELLYRDVRIDLRNQYQLIVDCQSYVEKVNGATLKVDLLIPQTLNEALFPMDFLIEPAAKNIYPNTAYSSYKLPVHIGETIVAGQSGSSFQYTRTVSKTEYAALETKMYNGVKYKVVPCYFKTNTAESRTTVYAYNAYFTSTPDEFLNVPVAFTDDSNLTIECEKSNYFGKEYPVKLKFNVTPEAVSAGKTFHIVVTEGGVTNTYDYTPTSAGEIEFTEYKTKTINGGSISVTITAQFDGREQESKTSSLTLNRRYFVIKEHSFKTNIRDFLDASQTGDGSSIYVRHQGQTAAVYVGWFGRGLEDSKDGYLTNDGPLLDYIIDRAYQNYDTLNENDEVTFQIYDPNRTIIATTTIGDLDNARIWRENNPTSTNPTLTVTFIE